MKPLEMNRLLHSAGVAVYMSEHAAKYGIDPETAYIVGLLHDIGYIGGRDGHENRGANLLANLGVRADIADAIRPHGNFGDIDPGSVSNLFLLLIEADTQIDGQGAFVGFDGRLEDVGRRYGYDSENYREAAANIAFARKYTRK